MLLQYIMEQIFEPNSNFNFDNITICNPIAKSGGSYFIKFLSNGTPLYIQPPKCGTRQGFVYANRKCFIDLLFSQDNLDFIQWLENLESFCHKKIYDNRNEWFEGDLELSDIENYFTSPIKIFKSGKYYLVRCDIYSVLGKPQLQIFDEKENEVPYDKINDESVVMNILEIKGIKCSSRSFQIVIEIKQMMKLEKVDLFSKCIIKRQSITNTELPSSIQKPLEESVVEESVVEEPVEENVVEEPVEESVVEEPNQESVIEEPNQESVIEEPKSDVEPLEIIEDETNQPIDILENSDKINEEDITINDPSPDESNVDNELENTLENNELQEINITADNIPENEEFEIVERKDVYYKMYKDARKKAKLAKELSVASYLEAQKIKNTYMLDDIDSDSDDDETLE